MARRPTWESTDQLIAVLVKEHECLGAEIDALRRGVNEAASGNRAAAIVCQYLLLGNASEAADWANELGWRVPPIVPKRNIVPVAREWTSVQVFALLDDPHPAVPVELVRLARRLLKRG